MFRVRIASLSPTRGVSRTLTTRFNNPKGELLGADLSSTVSDRADDDMDLFAAINPLLVVSGFVVGMLVGLTGVGGGSLMTPILVLLFGVHATTAVGTDLLYAAITKTGGTLTHGLKGTVDFEEAVHDEDRKRQLEGDKHENDAEQRVEEPDPIEHQEHRHDQRQYRKGVQ